MKKVCAFCSLLLLSAAMHVHAASAPQSGNLDWSVEQNWKMTSKPLSFVQSLDNKKVFILGDDATVRIYSATGEELGSIPVDKDITAIDIAPRGEKVYLLNGKEKSYTALSISFTQNIDITGSPFLGNENAPVTLIVFSDFQ